MTQEISHGGYGPEPITMKKRNERRSMGAIPLVGLGVAVAALLGAVAVIHPGLGQIGSGNPSLKADSIPVAVSQGSLASALSVQAIDDAGLKIPSGGTTSSSAITISNYHGGGYMVGLECYIDSFPVYCDGSSPVTMHGLPPGAHSFILMEEGSSGKALSGLEWTILP